MHASHSMALHQPLVPHMTFAPAPSPFPQSCVNVSLHMTLPIVGRSGKCRTLQMQAVQIAMDRKDREREQLSTLLSNLYPNTISQDQMAKGFTRLLLFTEVRSHTALCCIHFAVSQVRKPKDVPH